MSIEMIRIDDRLIHGQVIVGWCSALQPDRLLLCDDEVAASAWECKIYREAAGEYNALICTARQTFRLWKESSLSDSCYILIVSSPKTLVSLSNLGLKFDKIIVGGMHYESGKQKILDYVYLDDNDLKNFRILSNRNVEIACQDLPNRKPVNLASLVDLN